MLLGDAPYVSSDEENVLAAVREYYASLNSGGNDIADMSALVEATSRLSLSNLDNWERLVRQGLYQATVNRRSLQWKFWRRVTPFPSWIDLCSGDGFKRERALRALSGAAPNSFFFAMAVRRLNDWVPQVRIAAREQLPSIALASTSEDVSDVLCVVLPHWSSWGRMETETKQALVEISSMEAVALSLKSLLLAGTTGPLASILSQAGRSPGLDAHLPEIAKRATQPSVRAKAYKFLLQGKVVWLAGRKWEWTDIRYCKGHFKPVFGERPLSVSIPLEMTLRTASRDRSALVRRVAADILIRDPGIIGPAAVELVTALASDLHPSVAEKGSFALKKLTQAASFP